MNLLNKISDVSETVSRGVSVIQSKKEYIGKQIINCGLLFIILLVFGCLDFATLTVHFEYLFTAGYWATILTKVVAGVCSFNIGINIMYDNELKKDLLLANAITEYEKLIKYKQQDFEYFITHIFNPKEKKKAYISQINKKIYLLNRVSKAKDRLLYSSDLPERQKEKEKNIYCIKRKELEELKTDEFIEKNLDTINVKYYEVDATVFELEIDGSAPVKGVKTKGNVAAGKAKASTSMVLSMVLFSMFITSFGLTVNVEQFESQMVAFWHYCLKCCEDIAIVLWQLSKGMLKTRKIISSELTQPYVGRNRVLKDYIEWRLTEQKPDDVVYKELNKTDDEIVVEMTEEEYHKLQDNENEKIHGNRESI